jgi:hypothetical protein
MPNYQKQGAGANKPRRSTGKAREEFARANVACAEIIRDDRRKYPPESLPAIWAAAVLRREQETQPAQLELEP